MRNINGTTTHNLSLWLYEYFWIILFLWSPSTLRFKGLGMRNLQYRIRICQKSHNTVTITFYVCFDFLWNRRYSMVENSKRKRNKNINSLSENISTKCVMATRQIRLCDARWYQSCSATLHVHSLLECLKLKWMALHYIFWNSPNSASC